MVLVVIAIAIAIVNLHLLKKSTQVQDTKKQVTPVEKSQVVSTDFSLMPGDVILFLLNN